GCDLDGVEEIVHDRIAVLPKLCAGIAADSLPPLALQLFAVRRHQHTRSDEDLAHGWRHPMGSGIARTACLEQLDPLPADPERCPYPGARVLDPREWHATHQSVHQRNTLTDLGRSIAARGIPEARVDDQARVGGDRRIAAPGLA